MKSTYVRFGLAVVLVLMMVTALSCFFIKNNDELEEDLIVGESIEKPFNFIEGEVPIPDSIVTSADIEAYEQAKQNISELERLTFYQNLTVAHRSLDYGGLLDGEVVVEISENIDPDLLVDLMMADIYAMSEASIKNQLFTAPIFTEEEIPEYAYTVTSAYPPLYLLEVMVRDRLLSEVVGSYEVPDRSSYFVRGMAMGLYYESDIEKAEEFTEDYMLRATASDDFMRLSAIFQSEVVTGVGGSSSFEDNLEWQEVMQEYQEKMDEEISTQLNNQ